MPVRLRDLCPSFSDYIAPASELPCRDWSELSDYHELAHPRRWRYPTPRRLALLSEDLPVAVLHVVGQDGAADNRLCPPLLSLGCLPGWLASLAAATAAVGICRRRRRSRRHIDQQDSCNPCARSYLVML